MEFICDECESTNPQQWDEKTRKSYETLRALSENNDTDSLSFDVDWLRAIVQVPCESCYDGLISSDGMGDMFQTIIQLQDLNVLDSICDNPRGYAKPNSYLIKCILENAMEPQYLSIVQHIRQRWNNGVISKKSFKWINTIHQDMVDEGDLREDDGIGEVLRSFSYQ